MKSIDRLLVGALLASTFSGAAWGWDSFYLGNWRITSSVVAPWWLDKHRPNESESKTLVGKTFTIRTGDITGPRQLGCKDPQFEVKQVPAEMLFQGLLEESWNMPKSLDSLGFKGKQWKTLITGCENELEFHFIDDRTATFGLNNYIFYARKM